MTESYRLQQALAAIHSGLRQMAEADGEVSTDIAADLPAEVSALEEAMRGVVREIQAAATLAAAARVRADELATRIARFQAREARARGVLMSALDTMRWTRRELPEATISLRVGAPSLYITDEAALPPEYVETRTTTHPKRKEINADLKAGKDIPGAALANPMPVLAIRGS